MSGCPLATFQLLTVSNSAAEATISASVGTKMIDLIDFWIRLMNYSAMELQRRKEMKG